MKRKRRVPKSWRRSSHPLVGRLVYGYLEAAGLGSGFRLVRVRAVRGGRARVATLHATAYAEEFVVPLEQVDGVLWRGRLVDVGEWVASRGGGS